MSRPEFRLVPQTIDNGELARQLRHSAMADRSERDREKRRARLVCLSVVGSLLFAAIVGPAIIVLALAWMLGAQ